MSAPGIFIDTAPSIPTTEDRTTRALPGTRDETTKVLAPEQTAVMGQQDDLLKQQTEIAERQRVATQAENTVKAETSAQMAEAAAKAQEEREKAISASDGDIALWRSKLREASDRYAAAPLPSLFHSGDDGRNALKGIGLALAAIGDARRTTAMLRAGQAPGAMSAVDDIIERDFAVQRLGIEKLKDSVAMARAGVEDATKARELLLAGLTAKKADVYDRIAKLGDARIAASKMGGAPGQPGTDAASLAAAGVVAEAKEKAVKLRMESVQGLTQEITRKFGGTSEHTSREIPPKQNGGGVEADKNAANFQLLKENGQWMDENMGKLSPEDIKGINAARAQNTLLLKSPTAGAVAGTLGVDTEAGLSPLAKEALDRISRAEDAIGRLKSGGAINSEESARFGGMLTPRPSDTPKDVAMRAKNMGRDIDILGQNLDRAPRNPIPARPGQPAPAATPATEPAGPPTANPKTLTPKERAIRLLKAQPSVPGAGAIRRQYGITDDDLRAAP